ncbi:YadA-like family protein [Neisseria leonii]
MLAGSGSVFAADEDTEARLQTLEAKADRTGYVHVNTGDANQAEGNEQTNEGTIDAKGGARAPGAVAAGKAAKAYGKYGISIGEEARAGDRGRGGAAAADLGKHAIAIGYKANAYNVSNSSPDLPNAAAGIAIGANAVASQNAVHIGNVTNTRAIQSEGKWQYNNRRGSTTVGAESYNGAVLGSILGSGSKITTGEAEVGSFEIFGRRIPGVRTQGTASTVVGAYNTVIANDKDKNWDGVANHISGAANKITGSNGALIVGSGNQINNAYRDEQFTMGDASAIVAGNLDVLRDKELGSVGIIGGSNLAENVIRSQVIGVGNTLKGSNAAGRIERNAVTGYKNTVTDVNNAFTAGSENTVSNTNDLVLMGNSNGLNNITGAQILGSNTVVSDGLSNIVAVGKAAEITQSNSVALGAGSTATREATSVNTATVNGITYGGFAGQGKAESGVFAVGRAGGERQIIHVAAGEISQTSTDAVNGSQLYLVAEKLAAEIKKGAGGSGGGTGSVVAPGSGIAVSPDTQNGTTTYTVSAKTDNTTVKVDDAGNITAVTAGLTVQDGKVVPPAATGALATAGDIADAINKSGWKLAADGTDGKELINPSDTVTFKAGDNLTVSRTGSEITYATKRDANFDSVTFDSNGPKISNNGGNLKVGGTDGQSVKITNVAAGTDDTDAVNVSQLRAAVAAVKTGGVKAGKNVTVDPGADGFYTVNAWDTKIISGSSALSVTPTDQASNTDEKTRNYTIDLAQTTKDDIQKGVDAKNTVDTKGITFAGDTGSPVSRKLGETVNVKGNAADAAGLTDGNIGVVANGTDTLTVKLNKDVNLTDSGSLAVGGSKLTNNNLTVGGNHPVSIDGDKGTIGGLTNKTFDPNNFTSGQAATEDQLKAVYDAASRAGGGGWHIQANGDAADFVAPGSTVQFLDGKNIAITRNGSHITVATKDDVSFNSVTAKNIHADTGKIGSVTLNADGITVGGGANPVSLTGSGLNNGGNRITNVAAGVADTDAVNVGQLRQLGGDINRVAKKAYAGVAGAMAQSAIPQVTRAGANGVGIGGGYYGGRSAVAVGMSSMSDSGNWIVKGTVSANSSGRIGASTGALYQW